MFLGCVWVIGVGFGAVLIGLMHLGETRKDVIYFDDGLVSNRESVESLNSIVMGFSKMLRKTFQRS